MPPAPHSKNQRRRLECSIMTFTLGDRVLDFLPVTVELSQSRSTDLFGKKNNKTVAQTLLHPKYSALAPRVLESYSDFLGRNIGDFLLELKRREDPFYVF